MCLWQDKKEEVRGEGHDGELLRCIISYVNMQGLIFNLPIYDTNRPDECYSGLVRTFARLV